MLSHQQSWVKLSNLKQRSTKKLVDSWNSEVSNSFSRSNSNDYALIPRLHPQALQQTQQCKGSPSNQQHADSLRTVVVAHASSRSGVTVAHSTFPDSSQLVLAKKFFPDARLRSWIAIHNSKAESDLRIPFRRRQCDSTALLVDRSRLSPQDKRRLGTLSRGGGLFRKSSVLCG